MRINRRRWFARWAAVMGSLMVPGFAFAQTEQISLKQQLEMGLRARREQEFDFIEIVDNMVRTGQLPRKIVTVSFNWARKRNVKHPYQYFVRALRILASRQGIDVPQSG